MRISAEPPYETTPVVLTSAEAVRAWAERELSFWTPLADALPVSARPFSWDRTVEFLDRLRSIQDENDESSANAEKWLKEVVTVLGITSRDPRASFLQSLIDRNEDPDVVRLTYYTLLDYPKLYELRDYHHTAVRELAVAYRAAWQIYPTRGDFAEQRRSLTRITDEFHGVLAGLQNEHSLAAAAVRNLKSEVERVVSEASDEWKSTRAAFEQEQAAFREKLTVGLSLRAPVDYWSDKSKGHGQKAVTYLKWSAGIAAAGLAVLGWIGVTWLIPVMTAEATAWWALALFSVMVAFWAWPLRLTSRLYLTHTHLAEDAAEREVVTKTFLALGDAVELTADDRHLLLAALFRSSSVGLVKEDTGLSMVDLVVSRWTGKE